MTSIFNRIIFGLDEAIQAPILRLYQRGDEMKKDALEKFLKEKKISNEEKLSKFDRVARLKQWQVQVAFLYQQIEKYLEKAVNEGNVRIEKKKTNLTEEFLTTYSVDKMVITVGGERVTIEPRGTLIIGAFGRCDMNGEGDTVMLVLLPPGDKPGVHIRQEPSQGGINLKISIGMDNPEANISDAQWYFASRDPQWRNWPLSKETFTEALQAVMRK